MDISANNKEILTSTYVTYVYSFTIYKISIMRNLKKFIMLLELEKTKKKNEIFEFIIILFIFSFLFLFYFINQTIIFIAIFILKKSHVLWTKKVRRSSQLHLFYNFNKRHRTLSQHLTTDFSYTHRYMHTAVWGQTGRHSDSANRHRALQHGVQESRMDPEGNTIGRNTTYTNKCITLHYMITWPCAPNTRQLGRNFPSYLNEQDIHSNDLKLISHLHIKSIKYNDTN